ncbi:MAG TPA: YjjG family noncanonical pyrimidine nucleotidase [Flavobacteriaceae bacterium]|nr:YjjG family noncanonical pyrimidine nucleotidase [Flavobacteriaceae bacterium]|tara:strand:+ start:3949 stop:4638 length:690 start_codon:yes stop_codon:yes gene_type:complete
MNKNNITDIFFDLDHTLWDFDKNSNLTFIKIFKLNELEIDVDVFLEAYHPINTNYWNLYRENKISKEKLRFYRLADTFKMMKIEVGDSMIRKLSFDYIDYLSDFNHLIPGAIDILEYLKNKYTMHIITNGFKEVQKKKLEKSTIFKYFKTITISEEVGYKKPNPIIFNYALKKANAINSNSLMIGDSYQADILGAINIGVNAILFNYHKIDPEDHIISVNNLSDLRSYL